jgi:ribulose kinase
LGNFRFLGKIFFLSAFLVANLHQVQKKEKTMPAGQEGGPYFVGVDVGTGSARAALVTVDGTILAESTYATTTFRVDSDSRIFEQSTKDIWSQISQAVQDVLRDAKVDKSQVKGIGFDATCSLAVTNQKGTPITVTPDSNFEEQGDRNVILWADHRAEEEAKLINSTGNMVLNYVGKTMSVSDPISGLHAC